MLDERENAWHIVNSMDDLLTDLGIGDILCLNWYIYVDLFRPGTQVFYSDVHDNIDLGIPRYYDDVLIGEL